MPVCVKMHIKENLPRTIAVVAMVIALFFFVGIGQKFCKPKLKDKSLLESIMAAEDTDTEDNSGGNTGEDCHCDQQKYVSKVGTKIQSRKCHGRWLYSHTLGIYGCVALMGEFGKKFALIMCSFFGEYHLHLE